eukprot:g19830.t1
MKLAKVSLLVLGIVLPAAVKATKDDMKNGNCAYNMYMCCWTENDGNGMEDNTDVCYVDGKFIPKEEQVDTHCHGFAWADGADHDTYIAPLHEYVKNFDHKETRGYYGRIKGGRQCGCTEDMPIVERADCTTINANGDFVACPGNDLIRGYDQQRLSHSKGTWPPNPNRHGNCGGADFARDFYTPEENKGHFIEGGGDTVVTSSTTSDYVDGKGFIREGETFAPTPAPTTADERTAKVHSCAYNMYMCCWTENDGNGMEDNTDVCSVNGKEITKQEQVDTHCHGFAWKNGADYDTFIEPLYHYVRNFDHKGQRGYYGRIEGGRQCACTEDMPIVERADCTTIDHHGNFVACRRNDLITEYSACGSPGGFWTPNPSAWGFCGGFKHDESEGHHKEGGGRTDLTSSSTSYMNDQGEWVRDEDFMDYTNAPSPAPYTPGPTPATAAPTTAPTTATPTTAAPAPAAAKAEETPSPSEEAEEAHPEPTLAPTDETPYPSEEAETLAPTTAAPTTAAPVPAAAKPEETPNPSEEAEYSYVFDYNETPAPTYTTPATSMPTTAAPVPAAVKTEETPCPSEEAEEAHPEPTPAPTDETPCPSEEAEEAHPEPTPAPTDETPCPSEEAEEAHPEPTPAPTDETPCPSEEAETPAPTKYDPHKYHNHFLRGRRVEEAP